MGGVPRTGDACRHEIAWLNLPAYDQVVRKNIRVAHPVEGRFSSQCVEGHHDKVAVRPSKRVPRPQVCTGHDPEAQPKQSLQLSLPVADEARRGDDEDPTNPTPCQHLAYDQTCHDGLSSPRIVCEQET